MPNLGVAEKHLRCKVRVANGKMIKALVYRIKSMAYLFL